MIFDKLSNDGIGWKRLMIHIALIPIYSYIGLGIFAYFFAGKLPK